jgi:hypothetical protein
MNVVNTAATWHGTTLEWGDLCLATDQHCTCTFDLLAARPAICGAHVMLTDQVTLNHLLYCRRLRSWFVRNEFRTAWGGFVVPVGAQAPHSLSDGAEPSSRGNRLAVSAASREDSRGAVEHGRS